MFFMEVDAHPLAFLITFTCYGTWLHGDARGSVDTEHNQYGTRFLDAEPQQKAAEAGTMKYPHYLLDEKRRPSVLDGILEAAQRRHWKLFAVQVRSNHVHVVVQATQSAERVLADCKAFASKHLNLAFPEEREQKRWTRHGSTRYLWQDHHLEAAIDYVLHQQGEPMTVYSSSADQS